MAGCPQLVRGARTNSARRAYPTHPPQGNQLNPYINYPFLTLGPLRRYIAEAHKAGARVKLYYTVREISTSMTELWALRALRGEVRAPLPDAPDAAQLRRRRDRPMRRLVWQVLVPSSRAQGHVWLREHVRTNYTAAWHEARARRCTPLPDEADV